MHHISQGLGGHHFDGQTRGPRRFAAADCRGARRAGFRATCRGPDIHAEQQQWLDRIRRHLEINLTIDTDDFDSLPVFADVGGWTPANKDFEGRLAALISELNAAVAA